MKTLTAFLFALLLACGLRADTVLDRPEISIGFDDDASSLLISATWKDEHAVPHIETFNLGKTMHLVREKRGGDWVNDEAEFKSTNWEAFLLPDASGFLLMEREYNKHSFENISLNLYEYFPEHRVLSLRLANGSPYWSDDKKTLALVEVVDGLYNIVFYDIARAAVLLKKTRLDEADAKELIGTYHRARICDDEIPCESAPVKSKGKSKSKNKIK